MKITDEMLYQKVAEARDLWLDATVNNMDVPHHEYPAEFKATVKKQANLEKKQRKAKKTIRRVAAVFLACLIGSSTWLGFDVEARAVFVRWMKEMVGLSALYTYSGESPRTPVSDYRFGWTPEGMMPVDLAGDDVLAYVLYMGVDGYCTLTYQQMSESTNTQLNLGVEDMTHEVVDINGMYGDCYVTVGDNYSCDVIWFDETSGVAFTASGSLPKESILRMAESVELGVAMEMLPEYICSWLPEGYDVISFSKGTQGRIKNYHTGSDDKPLIRMDYKVPKDKSLQEQFYLDSYSEKKTLSVNDNHAELYIGTDDAGTNALVWLNADADLSFCLSSSLDTETLLQIAEGVNLK